MTLRSGTDQSSAAGKFTWNGDHTQFTYQPTLPLARDTSYVLTLPVSIQTASGEPMSVEKSLEYHTVAPLALISTTPKAKDQLVYNGGYGNITFKFNTLLAPQKFSPLFTFTPPVVDLNITRGDDDSLSVYGVFNPETTYHVTISSNLKDRWGGKLVAPVELDFSTSPAKPSLSFPMLEFDNTLFLRPEDISTNVQATNLNNLLVQSQPVN